ncbi:MAG TPA: GIY-YIG nuclease family protein [Terriglobales bacterium]|nr:GIY-YIG nuclease family protein [Terriglobales bacterium]
MIMSSSRRALYTGVTNSLRRRLLEHRIGEVGGFSEKYHCYRLVWFERYEDIGNAINREKQIKRWRREKKEWLIDRMNPSRRDLSADWGKPQDYVAPIFC